MTAPVLDVERYQFRDDGVVINADPTMPFVDLITVQGLDATPLRLTTKDHEGTDGGFVESLNETLRTVVLDCDAYADPSAMDTYMDILKENFEPSASPEPLYWMSDNGPRVVFGKSQGLNYTKTKERSWGHQKFNVTILCPDPRIYSPTIISSGPIYTGGVAAGGRGYPKSYPFGYGTTTASEGAGSITAGGNRDTPGWYVITGPIINPIVTNDTLGLQWKFTIALTAGQELWINPRSKTVRLGEFGPSRRNTLRGPWWLLRKGTNQFRLAGSGGTPGVTNLTVYARPAWR
jgi:hypothetical protein